MVLSTTFTSSAHTSEARAKGPIVRQEVISDETSEFVEDIASVNGLTACAGEDGVMEKGGDEITLVGREYTIT